MLWGDSAGDGGMWAVSLTPQGMWPGLQKPAMVWGWRGAYQTIRNKNGVGAECEVKTVEIDMK